MINKAGLEIIKRYEGLRLRAYYCPAKVLTIGYGHTGKDVTSEMVISQNMADLLLAHDCINSEKSILKLVKVKLSENQLSALTSFVFNVGQGNFKESTMLKLINDGKLEKAADEFIKWNKSNGQVLPGLVSRRQSEKDLFLKT